jgi:hypothetical protein
VTFVAGKPARDRIWHWGLSRSIFVHSFGCFLFLTHEFWYIFLWLASTAVVCSLASLRLESRFYDKLLLLGYANWVTFQSPQINFVDIAIPMNESVPADRRRRSASARDHLLPHKILVVEST